MGTGVAVSPGEQVPGGALAGSLVRSGLLSRPFKVPEPWVSQEPLQGAPQAGSRAAKAVLVCRRKLDWELLELGGLGRRGAVGGAGRGAGPAAAPSEQRPLLVTEPSCARSAGRWGRVKERETIAGFVASAIPKARLRSPSTPM